MACKLTYGGKHFESKEDLKSYLNNQQNNNKIKPGVQQDIKGFKEFVNNQQNDNNLQEKLNKIYQEKTKDLC